MLGVYIALWTPCYCTQVLDLFPVHRSCDVNGKVFSMICLHDVVHLSVSFLASQDHTSVRACMRACVVCFLVFFHTRDVKNFFQRMAAVCFELYVNLLISLLDDQQVKINMCLCFVHQQVLAACLLTNF